MKSKLLPQNSQVVTLVERFDDSVRVYFGDGHSEVLDEKIEAFFQKDKNRSKYKNPVEIYGQKLYPTKNQKDNDCFWINIDYLDYEDKNYILLLKRRDIFDKAVKMFLKQKEIQLKMLSLN